mmetsp:Transcript_9475/g.23705  ORF Transcript_9475/g.23705 Transcript_9475/m.23705 type:complete len:311 (-) Transcript_9475:271-1203(-)
MASTTLGVGFIGLGKMGLECAKNILQKRGDVQMWAYNRTASKVEDLRAAAGVGADRVVACSTPSEVANHAKVVFTMLLNDASTKEVCTSMADALTNDTILVNLAFVSPDLVADLTQNLPCRLVNCMVFGRPTAAATGSLVLCVGGARADVDAVQTLLDCMGQRQVFVSEHPRDAATMKIVGNFFVATVVECFAEAAVCSEKAGLPAAALVDVICHLFPQGGLDFRQYAERVAYGRWHDVGGSVYVGLKDTGMMKRLAEQHGAHVPLADAANQTLRATEARGRGNLDWTACTTVLRELAGLAAEPSQPGSQ